jgi:membrane protein required for colicin V production
MGLTALDIIVILALLGGGVLGWIRGFVMEVLSLGAWIAAILAVKLLHTPLTAMLTHPVGTVTGAAVLAFVLPFAVVFLGGKLVAAAIGRRTRTSALGPADRLLGLGFGALKALIGASLLFLLAQLLYDTAYGGTARRPDWLASSRTYPLLKASSRAIVDWYQMRQHAPASGGNATNSDDAAGNDESAAEK